jgi:hypothetical protein
MSTPVAPPGTDAQSFGLNRCCLTAHAPRVALPVARAIIMGRITVAPEQRPRQRGALRLASALDVNGATAYQLAISVGPQMSDVNKAARDYLSASGAVPICIIQTDGVCTFILKLDPLAAR